MDASQNGYGQFLYLRIVNKQNEIHCVLVMAESWVSPIKLVTIPRLELTAALISARVNALLRNELEYINLHQFGLIVKLSWGMSTTNLDVSTSLWQTQQIRDLSSPIEWKYDANQPCRFSILWGSRRITDWLFEMMGSLEFLWLSIEEDCGVIKNVSELPLDDTEVKRDTD